MIKEILKYFFVTLGVIFFFIIIAVSAFIIIDPFNLRPLFFALFSSSTQNTSTPAQKSDKNPMINEDQEKLLESIGVDVEALPSEITPQMQECFVKTLGEQRANEIANGDSPTLVDALKAKECLE